MKEQKIEPKTFELFYYNLRSSLMHDKKDDINLYSKLIKKCLENDKDIINVLGEYRKKELYNLLVMVNNNIKPLLYSSKEYLDYENTKEDIIYDDSKSVEEKELNRHIFSGNVEEINKLINRDLKIVYSEHPVNNGFVDITAKDEDNSEFWIMELKKDYGDHKIIGQCVKYIQYFDDRLIYKLYDKVRCLTICGGYNSFALKELKKLGIHTIKYENVCGKIYFYNV